MSNHPYISVVSPVYLAEKIVAELVKRIIEEVSKITPDFEIILVNDGSPDNSWDMIAAQCKKYDFVKGVKLSRNFGQQYAITAGLEMAAGDWVVVMDCDLQDNPKYIFDLHQKALEGFDIVYSSKMQREHNFFKNISAKIFFTIFNYLSDNTRADDETGAYSILSRKVVNAFCKINEFHRHYLMILRLLGFKSATIKIVHEKRFEGKSSYSFAKLVQLAINGVASQSDKLLKISINLGFFLFITSSLWATYIIASYLIRGSEPGYTSIMAMLLLATGLILMSIGITGIYIGKIFEQVKARPLYFVDETLNLSREIK